MSLHTPRLRWVRTRLGIALLNLSDIAGHLYNAAVTQQAIDWWTGDPGADAAAERRLREFADAAEGAVARVQRARACLQSVPMGNPERYQGVFWNERLGRLELIVSDGSLVARMGALRMTLIPTGVDKFASMNPLEQSVSTFTIKRGSDNRATALLWDDREFLPVTESGGTSQQR